MAKIERNTRHPSREDRDVIRGLADRIDADELIRVIGSIIAHDHPDADAGTAIRARLNKIATDLMADETWLFRGHGRPLIEVLAD
jgi:hypothetical protein